MSKGFFEDKALTAEGAGEPWDKNERDRALDEYFAGADPKVLGVKYKGSRKAFTKSILEKLTYNYKKKGKEDQPGRAERYQPVRRTSRAGMRMTENEKLLAEKHAELGIDPKHTSRILQRSIKDFTTAVMMEGARARSKASFAPTLDVIWAHRYVYMVYRAPVISDEAYDDLVKEEIEYGGGERAWEEIKSYRGWPDHVKALAHYLRDRMLWDKERQK